MQVEDLNKKKKYHYFKRQYNFYRKEIKEMSVEREREIEKIPGWNGNSFATSKRDRVKITVNGENGILADEKRGIVIFYNTNVIKRYFKGTYFVLEMNKCIRRF